MIPSRRAALLRYAVGSLLLALLAGAAGLAGAAQQPGSAGLGAPALVVRHGFSRIAGVAELPGGRVLVADSRDHLLYLADTTGGVTQLGRNGQGPDEYTTAFGLVRGPGDTVYLYDPNGSRFVRIDPAGRIAGSLAIPVSARRGGLAPPRGVDTQGRFYWEGGLVGTDASGNFKRSLRAQVRRWVPGQDTAGVATTFADHAPALHQNRFFPYAERDAWVVAPDGRVGVLVAAEYRLRWFRDGAMVGEGPRLDHEPVTIGRAERESFREERAAAPAGMARASGPPGSEGERAARRRGMEEAFPDEMFPSHKPPFVDGGAWLSPGGDVWVLRSRAAGDRVPRVDVLDPAGRRRVTLVLPAGSRPVALGRLGVYLAEADGDGVETLRRYRLPGPLR